MGVIYEAPHLDGIALNHSFAAAGKLDPRAVMEIRTCLLALRSALRMSQAQLARRSGVPRSQIALIESGRADPRLSTLRRLFDAMFCDLIVLPKARKRPRQVIGERQGDRPSPFQWRIWDDP